MERSAFNQQYAAWIRNKIQAEFSQDISLALTYGSFINGTAGSKSDVDCYFIPATQAGYALARTFLFDDVGYDLFPMDWERVARIAGLEEGLPPLLGDVEILYARSQEDIDRFSALQALLKKNLADKNYTRSVAARKCQQAATDYAQLKKNLPLHQVRKIAGFMIMTLADAVALYNQDYYHRGTKMQFADLQTRFPGVPEEIALYYRQTAEGVSAQEIITSAGNMLEAVHRYMELPLEIPQATDEAKAVTGPLDVASLAGLYEEISATFQKIYLCCKNGNHILAFLSAVVLQGELDFAMQLGSPEMDILSTFDCTELTAFVNSVQGAQDALVRLILDNGGKLHHYHSFSEFEAEN